MKHFLPLFALGPARDPERVLAFLRSGVVPPLKVQAVQALLAAEGEYRNAIWLLLIPYGFSAVRRLPDDRLRAALARACEVRAGTPSTATPAVQKALAVLRGTAAELVPGYAYGAFASPLGQTVAAATLRLAARTEELGGAADGCVETAALTAAADQEPLDEAVLQTVKNALGLRHAVQLLLQVVQQL